MEELVDTSMHPQIAHSVTGPLVFSRKKEPTPTEVFDTYWYFAAERHCVYLQRIKGARGPWTSDKILQTYKFTNAYRASDRVSQYLIKSVIGSAERDWPDEFLRILLFKLFNKIETWELLEHDLGIIDRRKFSVSRLDHILSLAREGGAAIYSCAYIMPSGPAEIRRASKHLMHLELLESLMMSDFPRRVAKAGTMEKTYELLLELPGIGPFLAYQFATDLNYSSHLNFSEMEFVMPGPGARDGIKKCFSDLGDYSEAEVIRWMADRQNFEFQQRGIVFPGLWGRELQLIDCQNLFCEVDKYARVAHPEIKGRTGRMRIKQKFSQSRNSLETPCFPVKWGLSVSTAPAKIKANSRKN